MQNENKIKENDMSPLRRSYIPIICTFIIGVVVSLTLFVISKNWEQANQRIEFESRSRGYINAIQNKLNKHLGTLNFLGDFFNQSQQITRREFTIFAESALSRYPAIQAFSWNPLVMGNERAMYESLARKEGRKNFKFTERTEKGALVDAAQRQEYVVVYYIVPLKTNEPALGYNIASETKRLQAIDKAFKTGDLTATDRITLVQETGNQFGVLIFFPLYQKGVSLKTLEARLKYRRGLVVEVLRLGDVVEAALKGFPDEGINLYLYDASAEKGNRLLYARPSRTPGMTGQPMDEEVIQKDIHWSNNFEIAGRQWKLLLSPSPFFLDSKHYWYSWLMLSGSLLLTAILILYLLKRLNYITEIECRVREQLRTNQELADEIAERKQAEEKIQASLREKEILLREIHHRVKNNMQVISGLLDLQSSSSKNPELIAMSHDSQRRIQAMSLVHEKLYGSKNFARVDLADYVRSLSRDLFQSYKINPGKIDLIVQTDGDVYVDINKAIPCGLILNELISNVFKHAFPGDRQGELQVIIYETKNTEIEIVVRDNGLGLPDDVDIHQPR
ncbi:MAG: CHASE domain-containing protein, partial [Pseudomonadota bacterium]